MHRVQVISIFNHNVIIFHCFTKNIQKAQCIPKRVADKDVLERQKAP